MRSGGHRRLVEALRTLHLARLAEAEALSVVLTALKVKNGKLYSTDDVEVDLGKEEIADESSTAPPSEDQYLSVRQLSLRIPYAEHTIRNLIAAGVLQQGVHYFKRRGRVMFSWSAIRTWVKERDGHTLVAASALPLARRACRGGKV